MYDVQAFAGVLPHRYPFLLVDRITLEGSRFQAAGTGVTASVREVAEWAGEGHPRRRRE